MKMEVRAKYLLIIDINLSEDALKNGFKNNQKSFNFYDLVF